MKGILTLTLNPAVDMTTRIARLKPREKLRCSEPRLDPGGGGINVSRVIRELGGTSTTCVVLAGPNGDRLRSLMEQAGLELLPVAGDGETRIDLQVYDEASGQQYRFVMPGPRQDPGCLDDVLSTIDQALGERQIDYVVASGSLAPGFPEDTFVRLSRSVQAHGAKLVLDAAGPPLVAAFGHGLHLIKPDLEEACELTGGEDLEPEELAGRLRRRDAAEVIIISLGAGGALLERSGELIRVPAPEVEVASTVGAGDSFIGGLVLALARDWPLGDAATFAVAVASATVLTEATELAHRDEVDRLFERLKTGS